MTREQDGAFPVRPAALLLLAALAAGPLATHVYWLLGGTRGLYTDGVQDEAASPGVRVVAALVVVLVLAAMLVVLARAGFWKQSFVSGRTIRLCAWALAAVFLLEALAAFTWSRDEPLWWMYGPVSLAIALLAVVVAGAGGRYRRPGLPWPVLAAVVLLAGLVLLLLRHDSVSRGADSQAADRTGVVPTRTAVRPELEWKTAAQPCSGSHSRSAASTARRSWRSLTWFRAQTCS